MMLALSSALILDAVLGEPRVLWDRWTHPAVLMGRAIGVLDRRWNKGALRKAAGVGAIAVLILCAGGIGWLVSLIPGIWADVLVATILLAHRSLVDHVAAVADGLNLSLGEGRIAVSNIVGRDTSAMDSAAVSRAAIESGAENFSDGVVAPAFWFAVAGAPGILIYKMVNTADSMIGYRTPRYEAFGWAAARLDDLMNLIPARLTAALLWAVTSERPAWSDIRADAIQHRSPNAGWPEAAMARAVGVALAGPRSYDGQMRDFPFVNGGQDRNAGPRHILKTTGMLWRAWTVMLVLCILGMLL